MLYYFQICFQKQYNYTFLVNVHSVYKLNRADTCNFTKLNIIALFKRSCIRGHYIVILVTLSAFMIAEEICMGQ